MILLTAHRWLTTTRLALALFDAGLTVDALCPPGHSLEQVNFVCNTYRYSALSGIREIRNALLASNADFIIPTDDWTAARLHELYKLTTETDPKGERLLELIARSLGDPNLYPVFYARDKIAAAARSAGVHSPMVTYVRNKEQLLLELASMGFPAVLKTDGSSGGYGVAIAQNIADAEFYFRRLAHHSIARALKRLIIDSDATLLLPSLRHTRERMTIQPFINGRREPAAAIAVLEWTCSRARQR